MPVVAVNFVSVLETQTNVILLLMFTKVCASSLLLSRDKHDQTETMENGCRMVAVLLFITFFGNLT